MPTRNGTIITCSLALSLLYIRLSSLIPQLMGEDVFTFWMQFVALLEAIKWWAHAYRGRLVDKKLLGYRTYLDETRELLGPFAPKKQKWPP